MTLCGTISVTCRIVGLIRATGLMGCGTFNGFGVCSHFRWAGPTGEQAGADKVQEALAHLRAAAWQQTQPVGVGEEFRSDTDDGRHASALVLDGAVVHGSLVTAG